MQRFCCAVSRIYRIASSLCLSSPLTEAIKIHLRISHLCLHRKLRRAFASAAGADVICAVTKQLTHMCAAA